MADRVKTARAGHWFLTIEWLDTNVSPVISSNHARIVGWYCPNDAVFTGLLEVRRSLQPTDDKKVSNDGEGNSGLFVTCVADEATTITAPAKAMQISNMSNFVLILPAAGTFEGPMVFEFQR